MRDSRLNGQERRWPGGEPSWRELCGEAGPEPWRVRVQALLAPIPREDRDTIDRMLYSLVKSQQLGYPLFGAKPVAICSVAASADYVGRYGLDQPLVSDWRVWERHAAGLETGACVMCLSSSLAPGGNREVSMINLPQTEAVIREHQGLFRTRLGARGESQAIVSRLLSGETLDAALMGHDALIGVLLGYGRDNALRFEGRGAAAADAELALIHVKGPPLGLALGQPAQISHVGIGFRGDPAALETRQVWNALVEASYRIEALLQSENFLEDFLGACLRPGPPAF